MNQKLNKLFLVLSLIIFSLLFTGCSSIVKNVKALYIKTTYEYAKWELNGQYYIINTDKDLIDLLENDALEKYNDAFFEENLLIAFKIVEENKGNISEIQSYKIKKNLIEINIKTIQEGNEEAKEYWWFILELNKDEVKDIQNVKIIKNKKEIMNTKNMNLYNEAIQCFLETKINKPTAKLDDVLLHRYLGIYNDCLVGVFLEKGLLYKSIGFTHTIEDLVFSYRHGHDIVVYNNGKFISLAIAYSNNLLSYNDLVKIHEIHENLFN